MPRFVSFLVVENWFFLVVKSLNFPFDSRGYWYCLYDGGGLTTYSLPHNYLLYFLYTPLFSIIFNFNFIFIIHFSTYSYLTFIYIFSIISFSLLSNKLLLSLLIIFSVFFIFNFIAISISILSLFTLYCIILFYINILFLLSI